MMGTKTIYNGIFLKRLCIPFVKHLIRKSISATEKNFFFELSTYYLNMLS